MLHIKASRCVPAALSLCVGLFLGACGALPEDFGANDATSGTVHALTDTPPATNDPGWSTTEDNMNVLAARGLYTSPSQIGTAPPGAMVRADNARIRRAGVVENRRGEEALPALSDVSPVDAMTAWRGVVVAHRANGKLARFSSGIWTDYTGTYLPPPDGAVRFVESAGDLLFTTSAGVYRLDDVAGTPILAGVPAALQMSAELTDVGTGTALAPSKSVAYRVVWGTRSASDRLLLGAPSGRTVIYNTDTEDPANVSLTIPLPPEVTTEHFAQVYRTRDFGVNTLPDDEMALVYEAYPTALEVTNRAMTFKDIAPEPTGANLYSNPNSGNGVLSQKDRPPLARVLGSYKGFAFYGDIAQRQRVTLTLLGVGGDVGLQEDDGIIIRAADGSALVYKASTTLPEGPSVFRLHTDGTPAQNIANTAQSLVRAINSGAAFYEDPYRAVYLSAGDSSFGLLAIEARSPATPAFTVTADRRGNVWSPPLPSQFVVTTLSRSGSTVTAIHGGGVTLSAGMVVELKSTVSGFPTGLKTVVTVSADRFTYTETGSAVAQSGSWTFATTTPPARSDNAAQSHGFAWSDFNGPDAVPPSQYDVLPTNEQTRILWAFEAGSSFLIGTTAGLFRLTGTDPSTFRVEPMDPSYVGTSGALAAPLAGKVVADSNRGVLLIGESSVGAVPVSAPIDNDYAKVKADTGAAFYAKGFFMPYAAESEVEVWLPSTSSDTHATQAYVLNTLTGAWTRDTNTATAAVVGPDGRRYFGQPTGAVWRERKAGTAADYFLADGATGVPLHVTYVGQNGGDPTRWKQWTELYFHLQSGAPTQSRYEIYTDYRPAPYSHGLISTGGAKPGAVWMQVDQYHTMCRVMFVGFKHSFPGERVELTGYGVRYRPYGTSGGTGGDMTE